MKQEVKAKVQVEPWGGVRACAVSCGGSLCGNQLSNLPVATSISYPPSSPLVLVSIRWGRSDASTVSGLGIVGSIYHPFQLAAPKQCGLINKRCIMGFMEGCGHTGLLQRYCTKAMTHQTPTCNGFWGCSRLFSCCNINQYQKCVPSMYISYSMFQHAE